MTTADDDQRDKIGLHGCRCAALATPFGNHALDCPMRGTPHIVEDRKLLMSLPRTPADEIRRLRAQLAAAERRALRADEKAEGMQAAFNATFASERAAREKAEATVAQVESVLPRLTGYTIEQIDAMDDAALAGLLSVQEAREKAERERDEWKANAILHGGNFEREALAHNTTRSSLVRAVEALGKLTAMACSRYRYGYECDCATCRITRPVLAEVSRV